MDKLMHDVSNMNGITPVNVQQYLYEKTKTNLNITNIRKIMHRYNMTPKHHTVIHVNRASKEEVSSWQSSLKKRISRLENRGCTVFVQDESIFVHDVIQSRVKWSLRGSTMVVPYTGSHKRLVMYGAISENNKQFIRTHSKFNTDSFVKFTLDLHQHFGKVAVIIYKAPQHRSDMVRNMLADNRDIEIIYLLTGSPQLNATEELWHRAKRDLMVSQHYPTFADLRCAVSEYFRTMRHHLDIKKYLFRNMEESLTNF
ncbi:MAG: IS630 family transposase [Nitrosopumilus sp. B06]|nr:MAG: IS630 family transposase [Nitrosopumilus sp. B06]